MSHLCLYGLIFLWVTLYFNMFFSGYIGLPTMNDHTFMVFKRIEALSQTQIF